MVVVVVAVVVMLVMMMVAVVRMLLLVLVLVVVGILVVMVMVVVVMAGVLRKMVMLMATNLRNVFRTTHSGTTCAVGGRNGTKGISRYSLDGSSTCSPSHLATHSLNHTLTKSLILAHSRISGIRALTHSFIHLKLTQSILTLPLTHLLTYLLTYSLT